MHACKTNASTGNCIFVVFLDLFIFCQVLMNVSVGRTVYSTEKLFSLKYSKSGRYHPIPNGIKECFRGCYAGAKVKA